MAPVATPFNLNVAMMSDLTPTAQAFLDSASSEDLLTLLQYLVNSSDAKDIVDLIQEEEGDRMALFQIRDELFLMVEIGKDVEVEVIAATKDEVRDWVLQQYGGFRVGRKGGFDLGLDRGDEVPLHS